MTAMANPVADATGFIADYGDWDPTAVSGRAARIMRALLDEHRAHVAYLEGEVNAIVDRLKWSEAHRDDLLRWPR